MSKKKLLETFTDFDDYLIQDLKDSESAQNYLQEILTEYYNDKNIDLFLHCLKPLIKAQGSISRFSEKTGINRTYLYKIFNNKVKPEFHTLVNILENLGFQFTVKSKKCAN
jgi:probable addiction module antidote protein